MRTLLKDSLRESAKCESAKPEQKRKCWLLRPADESRVFEIVDKEAEVDLVLSGKKYGFEFK